MLAGKLRKREGLRGLQKLCVWRRGQLPISLTDTPAPEASPNNERVLQLL